MSETPIHDGKTRTIPEYAERLRVSTSKIRGWLNEGTLTGMDVANGASSRPQIVFTPEQQMAFERSRSTCMKKRKKSRGKRSTKPVVKRFVVGGPGEHIEV